MEMVPRRLLANARLRLLLKELLRKPNMRPLLCLTLFVSEEERAPPGMEGRNWNYTGCLAESLALHARLAFLVQALISVTATASHQFRPEEPSLPIS